MSTPFQALVLAGSRGGVDPVADYAGVSQKGLIVLGGQTLLHRVLAALDQAGAARIAVSTNDKALEAALKAEKTEAALSRLPSAAGPSQSVHEGAEAMGTPLLVTTVDHALLRPEWVIWVADSTPSPRMKSVKRLWLAIWLSSHRPRSPCVTRPRGSTAQFSVNTMPNLPSANLPRWTRWKSFTSPSVARNWTMGETTQRLGAVTPRILNGEKRSGFCKGRSPGRDGYSRDRT